jgi:hypothetical protein
MVSLYAGKRVVGYAHPRRMRPPRLRVYVGEACPEWATPDPTYESWCSVDDWARTWSELSRSSRTPRVAAPRTWRRGATPTAGGCARLPAR